MTVMEYFAGIDVIGTEHRVRVDGTARSCARRKVAIDARRPWSGFFFFRG